MKMMQRRFKVKKKTKDDRYIFCKTISNYKLNLSLTQHKIKQGLILSRGVLRKGCAENMQQRTSIMSVTVIVSKNASSFNKLHFGLGVLL